MPATENEVATQIRVCVAEWQENALADDFDEEVFAELGELETSLLRVKTTFGVLVSKYKIPLTPLLERLRNYRVRWRFTNPARLFDQRTLRDIGQMPHVLEVAARFIENGGAVFVARAAGWATERFDRGMRGDAVDWKGPQSVDYHQIQKSGLSMDGTASGSASSSDSAEIERIVVKQSRAAALLLRRTAAKTKLLPWSTMTDDRGVPLFKAGPRRKRVVEAASARDLLSFFRDQTSRGNEPGRSLYEHAGYLLWATFPSLKDWRSPHTTKRLVDSVRQLAGAKSRVNTTTVECPNRGK